MQAQDKMSVETKHKSAHQVFNNLELIPSGHTAFLTLGDPDPFDPFGWRMTVSWWEDILWDS